MKKKCNKTAVRGRPDSPCCASSISEKPGDLLASKLRLYRDRLKQAEVGVNIIEEIAANRTEEERDSLALLLKWG